MKTRFKPKFNIKKGDTVVVIAGDDKDRTKPRQVLEVIPDKARIRLKVLTSSPSIPNQPLRIPKVVSLSRKLQSLSLM
jgi:ribosomal protein L24